MPLLRAILATILFILLVEAISLWLLISWVVEIPLGLLPFLRLINSVAELLIVYFVVRRLNRPDGITWQPCSVRYYIAAVPLGIGFVFVQLLLNLIYNSVFGSDFVTAFSYSAQGFLRWSTIASVFVFPFAEELFFRGYIHKRLQQQYSPVLAITVTALLFASIHLPFTGLIFPAYRFDGHHAYITFFGGILSGILYHKSGSLGPSVVFHAMWNLTSNLV